MEPHAPCPQHPDQMHGGVPAAEQPMAVAPPPRVSAAASAAAAVGSAADSVRCKLMAADESAAADEFVAADSPAASAADRRGAAGY